MQRDCILLVAVIGCIALTSGTAAEEPSTELKDLEGTWKVTAIEAMGREAPVGGGTPEKLVIADGEATFFAEGKEMPTFRDLVLETNAQNPTWINLIRGPREVLPCIYQLRGDELKIAMPLVPVPRQPGQELMRPGSFDTRGKRAMVLTAKRTPQ